MASTSASSIQKSFKYDVFLSFRGEDTRKTFVDHLYHALVNKGIRTYKDDERIEKGERISDELIRCIEDSRFHIIVFSKNYASSSWCLDELVHIIENQEKMVQQSAYPIFYDVEPTEVRNQTGAVGKAFAKHEKGRWGFWYRILLFLDRFTRLLELEKEGDVERWRNALKEAAGLAGMELKNTVDGHEAMFIRKLVEEISLKLRFIHFSFDENLVGMEARVKSVVSSLELDSDDVRMIGIKGIGGGGKTTLARAVFSHMSIWFEGKSFVENVREVSKGSLSGLMELQKQILKDVLGDKSIDVTSVYEGKIMMKKMMGSRKVLIVLDDVDDINQLEALAGDHNWFKSGSRIIITTRDEQVLKAHQVNFIHDVNLLSDEEAICLFSRCAFGREIPNQGYEELSGKVVQYASGLPLTIKVLGSFLRGRSEHEWVDTLERLKTIPLLEIVKSLELSYDGLEADYKEIFLDIACILEGETKEKAIRILESCGFRARIALRVLQMKSLMTISDVGRLVLQHHIKEMGMNIVRRLHPNEPRRHSRLWIKEEIEDILVNELGTDGTKCLKLQDSVLHPDIIMKGLRTMRKLRLLYVVNRYQIYEIDEVYQYLPDALQSLHWHEYPFWCLPKTFQANKLVNLEMPRSNITQLWETGVAKVLEKLRFLDLTFSKLRTFDLTCAPRLERLDLRGCADFVELHVPVECVRLEYLDLGGSKLPEDIDRLQCLEKLHLSDMQSLRDIPDNLCNMKCLKYLHLPYCILLKGLPEELGRLKSLKELNIVGTGVNYLPSSIFQLKDLCIVWSKDRLEWHGFTSLKKLSKYTASSYIYSCE
ncbi:putative TIR domain, P-loop containing nucleoside triphosphate hydrolase [Helianthus annuus]|nr:putative TIR domain, P-loop containing nucleoside triphosphate hydrolase [Helianthus annuus]